jgi:uncharacterized repeat protein (TIGR03803 family)
MRVQTSVPMLTALAVSFTLGAAGAATSAAVPYQVVHSFGPADTHSPNSTLVLGQDGNFYGTTAGNADGVDHGSVFRMDHQGNVSVLHAVTGTNGDQPLGLVQAPSGMFYGVTQSGVAPAAARQGAARSSR